MNMSYENAIQEAQAKGKLESVSVTIHTWEEPGEILCGRLLEVKPFEGSNFEQTCNQYIFDTDAGLCSTILGAGTDKAMEGKDFIGRVLLITYHGKKQLKDGRSVNNFQIQAIPDKVKDGA